jgi:putative transcriptional regulator
VSIWKHNRLRVLRAERRLTQYDLADALGISQWKYWQIENARQEPDEAVQRRIAAVFRVPVDELITPKAKAS